MYPIFFCKKLNYSIFNLACAYNFTARFYNESVMATKSAIKWRSILGLILLYLVIWYNWQWAWGILFLIWVIPDLISGVTHFIEPIEKKENPVLYWVIMVSWLLLCMYSIASLFWPELNNY